tara:strand:- start:1363 stop:1863 length:501 start_codon:yes stop_codon:yes gene_type:complete
MNKLFPIGEVTRASGLKGAVSVRPLSRYFDDYIHSHQLQIGRTEKSSSKLQLSKMVGSGKKSNFIFKGFNNRHSAEAIIGKKIFALVDELDSIHFLSSDLIGYGVFTNEGMRIGRLGEILWLPANDAYVINDGDKEFLIPIIPEIVKSIDYSQKAVLITPMEGLLD